MSRSVTLVVLNDRTDIGCDTRRPAALVQALRSYMSDTLRHFVDDDNFESFPTPRGFRMEAYAVRVTEEAEEPIPAAGEEPLRFCYPAAFAGLELSESEDPLLRAALAYIRALPDDWPIVIYWS